MSKGSRYRPVEKEIFDTNWDRIFSNKTERSIWEHVCKHNGTTMLFDNEQCEWCGETNDKNL